MADIRGATTSVIVGLQRARGLLYSGGFAERPEVAKRLRAMADVIAARIIEPAARGSATRQLAEWGLHDVERGYRLASDITPFTGNIIGRIDDALAQLKQIQ